MSCGLALYMVACISCTAAGFSGRMPCSHLADAIVSTARSTLQRAAALVDTNPAWGARVVYGGFPLQICIGCLMWLLTSTVYNPPPENPGAIRRY